MACSFNIKKNNSLDLTSRVSLTFVEFESAVLPMMSAMKSMSWRVLMAVLLLTTRRSVVVTSVMVAVQFDPVHIDCCVK